MQVDPITINFSYKDGLSLYSILSGWSKAESPEKEEEGDSTNDGRKESDQREREGLFSEECDDDRHSLNSSYRFRSSLSSETEEEDVDSSPMRETERRTRGKHHHLQVEGVETYISKLDDAIREAMTVRISWCG